MVIGLLIIWTPQSWESKGLKGSFFSGALQLEDRSYLFVFIKTVMEQHQWVKIRVLPPPFQGRWMKSIFNEAPTFLAMSFIPLFEVWCGDVAVYTKAKDMLLGMLKAESSSPSEGLGLLALGEFQTTFRTSVVVSNIYVVFLGK